MDLVSVVDPFSAAFAVVRNGWNSLYRLGKTLVSSLVGLVLALIATHLISVRKAAEELDKEQQQINEAQRRLVPPKPLPRQSQS